MRESRNIFYNKKLINLNDYYPYGITILGSTWSASTYRYAFNGKETDPETETQDYGFRIYNPRICKFLSVDPLTKKFPMLTPYQFASNTPIQAIDLDGKEGIRVIDLRNMTTTFLINVVYVPLSIGVDNKYTSGFTIEEAKRIQTGLYLEVAKANGLKDEFNPGFQICFAFNFFHVEGSYDASVIISNEPDRTVELNIYREKDNGAGSSELNKVNLRGPGSKHSNLHEFFHSLINYSINTPKEWIPKPGKKFSADFHNKFGGILSYEDHNLPISQSNINQASISTPAMILPFMGPYTQEQQKVVDQISTSKLSGIPFSIL